MGLLWLCDLDGPWPGARSDSLQSWRAWRGDVHGWRHYWLGDASTRPPAPAVAAWQPLEPGTDLPGHDAARIQGQAPYHYVVETDVATGCESELQSWYETEHLPGLASVPGCLRARRLVRSPVTDGLPLHVACYELLAPDVTESSPWLAVRHTDWSSRVRPMFRNTRRTLFVRPDLQP